MVGLRARVALAILLMLTACQGQQQEPAVTSSPPVLVVRHDVADLVRTFPALGAPVSAAWISWDNTGAEFEPSTLTLQWIDAVVQVTPETMKVLLTQHESDDTSCGPRCRRCSSPTCRPVRSAPASN